MLGLLIALSATQASVATPAALEKGWVCKFASVNPDWMEKAGLGQGLQKFRRNGEYLIDEMDERIGAFPGDGGNDSLRFKITDDAQAYLFAQRAVVEDKKLETFTISIDKRTGASTRFTSITGEPGKVEQGECISY